MEYKTFIEKVKTELSKRQFDVEILDDVLGKGETLMLRDFDREISGNTVSLSAHLPKMYQDYFLFAKNKFSEYKSENEIFEEFLNGFHRELLLETDSPEPIIREVLECYDKFETVGRNKIFYQYAPAYLELHNYPSKSSARFPEWKKICYLRLDNADNQYCAHSLITYACCEKLGISTDELFELAEENTDSLEIIYHDWADFMSIVTTDSTYGAVAAEKIDLSTVYQEKGKGFYILPCSLDEVILCYDNNFTEETREGFKRMVSEITQACLDEGNIDIEKVLSDIVYYYDGEKIIKC